MTYEEECAEALGFNSVEEMNKHQVWLDQQKAFEDAIRKGGRISAQIVIRDSIY